jgi:hypothetical protein
MKMMQHSQSKNINVSLPEHLVRSVGAFQLVY